MGSVSPMTTRLPALKMPDLSRAMSSRVGPRTSVWSKLMLVSDGHVAVDHVGAVPPAAQPDLDHGHVDRLVGEPGQGGGGEELEPGGALVHQLLQPGQGLEDLDEGAVVDGLAVAGRSAR